MTRNIQCNALNRVKQTKIDIENFNQLKVNHARFVLSYCKLTGIKELPNGFVFGWPDLNTLRCCES